QQRVAPAEPRPANVSPPAPTRTARADSQPVAVRARNEMPSPQTASAEPAPAPAGKKIPIQSGVATPAKSIFSEDLIWMVCLAIIGIATGSCFMLWLRSYRRPAIPALTLHEIVERSADL